MYNLVIKSFILFWIDDWLEERNLVAKILVLRKEAILFLDYLLTCFRQNYDPDLHSEYEESEGNFGIPLMSSLMRKRVIKSLTIAAEEVVPVRTNKWYPSVGQSAPPDLTHVKVLFFAFPSACLCIRLLAFLPPTHPIGPMSMHFLLVLLFLS